MRDNGRTRVILVVLLLASLTFIALDSRGNGGPVGGLRSAVSSVFAPVQRAVSGAFRPVRDFFGGLGQDQQAELDRLRAENALLKQQVRTDDYTAARLAELDKLLGTAGRGGYRIVAARVIAVSPAQTFTWTALIDAGSQDGLKVGMTVINGDGLVGRVKSLTPSTALILLAIDPKFAVGIRVEKTVEIGAVQGHGLDPMTLTTFDHLTPLSIGDRLVTQASDLFAGGVPVGELLSVVANAGDVAQRGTVRPYVDFTALDLVGVVVVQPRTDPRDSVLPPRPTPSASASAGSTTGSTASPGATASPSSSASRS